MRFFKYYIVFVFMTLICSQGSSHLVSLQDDYITGEDGVIRMNINIIGHVKNPGIYLVYDGIDLMSALSVAGGYLEGSKLDDIIIYHQDGSQTSIDLHLYLNGNSIDLDLGPNDTILVSQKMISKLLYSSNLPSILLGLLNIALTLDRTE